jgi:glycosyltransferase involved in cell wall biosynthesis
VVAPLRIARGIQNKILEAMAMAKAVIASTECAGPIDATPGEELLAASSAESFASQIDALLSKPEQAREIGRQGRAAVVARYSWDAHLSRIDPYLPQTPRSC